MTPLQYLNRKEDNMRLQEAIEKDEKEAHEEVKKLLRKYERFGVCGQRSLN